MKILAIDTSCDDTSVAVVERKNDRIRAISNVVSSQIKIHSPYGGVYPMLAKRAHQENLVPTLVQSLKKSNLLKTVAIRADLRSAKSSGKASRQTLTQKYKILNKILERDEILLEKTIKFLEKYEKPKVGAIAITNGPGLEPCLWQGVNFAKALAFWWDLPLIPVNHIKAHLAANWLWKEPSRFKGQSHSVPFPAIGLVASGGHTELIYIPKAGHYKLIGSTRDDAAGECFDKTARILGLPYPGGPAIAALAATFNVQRSTTFNVQLPRPMLHSNDFDFSFSGLKTAVLYNFQKQTKITRESKDYKICMAKEVQQSIVDVLISKTLKAASAYKAKSIITGGGVMANKELRKQFKRSVNPPAGRNKLRSTFYVPRSTLCMDNAAMVGACALLDKPKAIAWQKIKVNGNLNI